MRSAFCFLILATVLVLSARADEAAEIFAENTASHHTLGFVIQVDPATSTESGMVVLPMRFYGVRLDERGLISAYDSSSTLGVGATVVDGDPRFALGFDGRMTLGVGMHTPGTLMLYGMGTGELGVTWQLNGVRGNELRPQVGVEAGGAVATRSVFVSLGGMAEAAASILNPRGDHAEAPLGARARVAVKDMLFLRMDIEEIRARTSRDPRRRAGDVFLNFKLSKDFRPWTPALKFLVGFDGRVEELERGGKTSNAYYGGLHLITYRE